jgi:hypothetical protein
MLSPRPVLNVPRRNIWRPPLQPRYQAASWCTVAYVKPDFYPRVTGSSLDIVTAQTVLRHCAQVLAQLRTLMIRLI